MRPTTSQMVKQDLNLPPKNSGYVHVDCSLGTRAPGDLDLHGAIEHLLGQFEVATI